MTVSLRSTFSAPSFTGYLARGALLGAFALLAACQTTGGKEVTGFDQLNLAPGDTGNCQSSPCRVFLQMPAGSSSYEVTANQVKLGVFPAGQNVDLGSFSESSVIEIQGTDVPKTYIWANPRQ
jgi:hypothetical protein